VARAAEGQQLDQSADEDKRAPEEGVEREEEDDDRGAKHWREYRWDEWDEWDPWTYG
jgi:hypothetical protein